MRNQLDPTFVRAQIEQLRLTHPDIWESGDILLLADMLEGTTELHEFLTAVVRHMLETKASIGGIGEYMAELKQRQDRLEQRVDAMRTMAFKLMQAADVRKLELVPATLSIRAGQPRVIVTDEARLPEYCIRTKREADKVAIREHLTRGEHVPGAEMSNATEVITVRIK